MELLHHPHPRCKYHLWVFGRSDIFWDRFRDRNLSKKQKVKVKFISRS
jgi:hypothetical protein